jgi:hypothetical protein
MLWPTLANIAYIINAFMAYSFIQDVYNLPTYKRSFDIRWFTIAHPVIFNLFELFLDFTLIQKVFRNNHRMINDQPGH